jgi:hypothetical protein
LTCSPSPSLPPRSPPPPARRHAAVQLLPLSDDPAGPNRSDWGGTSLYAVQTSRPVPASACPANQPSCGTCTPGPTACRGLSGAAGGPPAACDGRQCAYPVYDPAAPLPPAAGRPEPAGAGWFYAPTPAEAAAAGAGFAGAGVAALLRIPAGAAGHGFDVAVTAYRAAAVCGPGSAGGGDASGVSAGPLPLRDFRGAPALLALDNSTGPAAGAFSLLTAAGPCAVCPNGTASPAYGAGDCAPCAPGRFQPAANATACATCAAGAYQPAAGAAECTACPAGAGTLLDGAAAASACFQARRRY